jgi:hypothetical protein
MGIAGHLDTVSLGPVALVNPCVGLEASGLTVTADNRDLSQCDAVCPEMLRLLALVDADLRNVVCFGPRTRELDISMPSGYTEDERTCLGKVGLHEVEEGICHQRERDGIQLGLLVRAIQ